MDRKINPLDGHVYYILSFRHRGRKYHNNIIFIIPRTVELFQFAFYTLLCNCDIIISVFNNKRDNS